MLCKDIISKIESVYPKNAAMEWDNVGLLVGRSDKEVKQIYVALDVTDEVIAEAIEKKADLLVAHHPLIFSPLNRISDSDFIGRRILKLIQNDISCYAMHTNYDILRMGQLAGEILGLENIESFEENGIGKAGELSYAMTVTELCKLIKEKFSLESVKIYGDTNTVVKKIAISPGSGKHMSDIAIEKKLDALVTAEIDHHEGIDSVAQGTVIIDAGHYGLEHIFIRDMELFLKEHLEGINVSAAEVKHPFCVLY